MHVIMKKRSVSKKERFKRPAPFSFMQEVEHMTKSWLKCAGIRAIRTVAQTAIAVISTSFVLSDVDWIAVISASILAGILSVLTSLAGLPEVEEDVF